MSAPAPLLKPKFKTSCPADLFDTFEVEIAQDTLADKGHFSPRPRMAFDQDDAVLALAEMLKSQGARPDDLLEQLGDSKLRVMQTRIAAIDGKHYEHLRLFGRLGHDDVLTKLRDFFGEAKVQPQATPAVIAAPQIEETQRISMGSPQAPEPTHPNEKPKKVLQVRTVYDGSGDRDEKVKDALKAMKPEDVPSGGLVITMGKNGPKILKAATARTDEEEADDLLEENEALPVTQAPSRVTVGAPAEVTISRDPNPEIPGLPHTKKTAAQAPAEPQDDGGEDTPVAKKLQVRTMSAEAMDKAPVAPVEAPKTAVLSEDMTDMGMDQDEAAAMIDAELGGEGVHVDDGELTTLLTDPKTDPDTKGMTQATEHGGHRVKKQESIIKRDRGGTRPVRAPQA